MKVSEEKGGPSCVHGLMTKDSIEFELLEVSTYNEPTTTDWKNLIEGLAEVL
jgi:hypothetical protein